MKSLRKFIVTALIFVSLTGMASANGQKDADSGEKTYRIGAAVYGLKGEYMRLWATALERHPAVESGLVDITVFDGQYDAGVQQSQFETMAAQQFDAILFVPIDIEAGASAVQVASEAGIPVIGSNTRVNSDLLTSYIGSDDVKSGYMEAKAVIEAMGGAGNVVIIEGPIGQSAQIERRKGNMKAIEEYGDNVNVLEMKTANWSRAEAMNLMENWLSAHPGDIDGIIGQNDEMALGAIQAIKDAGMSINDFPTAGIDGVTDAMLAVKNDEMVSILQNAVGQAQGALDLALRAVIGESYEPAAACWDDMEWGSTMQDVYNVPWVPITLENVDGLLEEREALTTRK